MLEMQNPLAQVSARICLLYWLLAAFWVWLSDRALLAFIADGRTIHRLQTYKGIFFVTLTAGWLYVILRRQVAREREQTEAKIIRLAALVESSNDAIISKTLEGTITSWNQAASELFGYTPEEIIGQNITTLFPPDRLQEEEEILARLQHGERITHYETVRRKKDGTLLPISLSVSPIKNAHGSLIGISKIARDISARKQIEAAWQESETRFRTLFEQSAVSNLIIDPEQNKVVDCNDVAAARLGYTKDELIGLPVTTFDRQKNAEEFVQLHDVLANGLNVQFETLHHTKTGEPRNVLVVATRLHIVGKAFVYASMLDITEQKQAEAALQQERERLEKLALASPSVICSYHVQRGGAASFLYVNPAIEQIYGQQSDDPTFDAAAIATMVHPADLAALVASIRQSARARQPWHGTWRVQNPRKGEIWVEGHFAPVLGPDRSITWHGILNDVTERKSHELKLAERERLLSAINDATPNMIFLWDVGVGRITYANQAVEALLGYSTEEVLSKTHEEIFRLFHPEDYAQQRAFHERLRRAGTGVVQSQEYRFLHKNGEWREMHTRDMIFECDAEGQPTRILSVVDDITERKQTLAALAQYTEELKRSNKDLEQFAYVASHDLQEPLRAVAGCVQILQRRYHGQLDAQADELIRHTIDGAARMQKLIEDLLAYSRLNTRGARWQPTSCEAVLVEAGVNLRVAIAESQAQITHNRLPTVRADMAQLILLFQNLLSNAIKFRGLAPLQIHIGAQRRDHQWLFSVRDNGIGLEPQYAERIFRIFQRLHTRTEYPGTGIGLAICQKIVEQHGGRIWVESNLGAGATFYFTLPADEVEPETMNEHARE
jgi:PAS domain S-box-containing protein